MIVSVFLILCFALGMYVYRRYAVALRTTSEARQALWPRVVPGCEEGTFDEDLRGTPDYASHRERYVPELSEYGDVFREERRYQRGEDRFVTSGYLGSREVTFRTSSSTICNETPETPEERLPRASVDTWCRVSSVCDPSDVDRLVGGEDIGRPEGGPTP
jgi:hypothetical protein